MRWAEFEEKDFEGPLYVQLLFGGYHLATPGQVFEGRFGIDSALKALHPLFWDFFGYPDIPSGCILNDFNWGFVWRKLGHKRPLPNFSTNLLIQSKRPFVLRRDRGALHAHGLSAPVWRYGITHHQQPILANIAKTLGDRALVIYASTAFDTFNALYSHTDNHSLVENCSYVRVQRLTNHGHWNYDSPGTRGIATSEAEPIEDIPFSAMLEVVNAAHNPDADAKKELYLISNAVTGTCRELADVSPLARRASLLLDRINKVWQPTGPEDQHVLSFARALVVFAVLGLRWFVGGDIGE